MTRILVTGGAGFVGSHIVDELVARGLDVVVLDLLHPGAHIARPDYCNPDADYLWGDLADAAIADRAVAGVDAVCHQASMVGLGADFADVEAYTWHNTLATASLLGALHRRRFHGRLVLASSMVVYGEGRYRCATHGVVRPSPRANEALALGRFEVQCPFCGAVLAPETVPEDAPLDPRNVYAATKLHQEHLCAAYAREHHDTPVGVLRYHNVYGPRMPIDTPYAGVASIFRSSLEHSNAPVVFEDGGQLRDFVHVRDVARANVLALTNAAAFDGACNIASGTPRTVGDMARTLSFAFGEAAPAPQISGRYRLGDVRHVFASTRVARDHLGFRAEVAFDDGIREFATAPLRSIPRIST